MSEKLKPCPFCGEVEAIRNRHMNSNMSQWGVSCDGCDAEGPWKFGKDEAIAAWNTRAQHAGEASCREAIATVCEGWTLPDGARKILETAMWSSAAPQPAEVPEAREPVAYIQRDQLEKAKLAPHLCRVEPTRRIADFVPIYAAPPSAAAPEGFALVPITPSDAMLDRAVAFALNVSVRSDYNWTAYMRDVWARMLSAAPQPREWDASATTTAGER